MTITPELRQAVQETGFVRFEDAETGEVYTLTRERMEDVLEQEVSEGIKKSQEAFARDLPELLKNKKNLKKWVAYNRDKQVMIHNDARRVLDACLRLGLEEDEFTLHVIEPNALETLEMDYPSSWL